MKSTLKTNKRTPRDLCVLASLCFVLLATPAVITAGASAQSTENRAGLVVQFPDDSTQTFCLTFEGDTISGLDLLSKSGLPLKVEAFGGLGAQICQVGPTGCDYPNEACVCQSYGPNGVYWSYHHLLGDQWKASITGAGSYRVHPGDVEGWAWSEGGPPTTVYTFDQLCPAPPVAEGSPATTPTTVEPPPTNTPTAIRPTFTTRPIPPSPTSTAISEAKPTEGQPSATPTPTATMPTSTATPTTALTPTPTSTSTPNPTTAPLTSTPTMSAPVTPTPPATTKGREDTARTLGIAIAVGVGVALAVWGVVMLIRRRNSAGEE